MSTETSQKLNDILKAGLEAPGYWRWVFDEPECVYSEASERPSHIPAGHWEWMPSAMEIFHEQQMSPTANLFFRRHNIEVSSKGHQIPPMLIRRLDDPE